MINWTAEGNIKFWVPLYRKVLFDVFIPNSNGENKRIAETMFVSNYMTADGKVNFKKLIGQYKNYIRQRSFRPFREKDKNGKFKSTTEAAMIYSFETFISIFIQEIKGKIYREAHVSLGNTDMIINVRGTEYFIETKKYYSLNSFKEGKKQLAFYCRGAGLKKGHYIVFIKQQILHKEINEIAEVINGVEIQPYLIRYDEERDFGKN